MILKTHQEEIEDGSIGQQRPEYKKHAGYHPRRDGRHSLCVWRDICDGVKNVDQHKEERYKECHPTRHNLRWDEKTNPRHYDKKSAGQVVDIQISGNESDRNLLVSEMKQFLFYIKALLDFSLKYLIH